MAACIVVPVAEEIQIEAVAVGARFEPTIGVEDQAGGIVDQAQPSRDSRPRSSHIAPFTSSSVRAVPRRFCHSPRSPYFQVLSGRLHFDRKRARA